MITKEEISEQFEEFGISHPDDVVDKCVDLCLTYNIQDPVEFVEQWIAFSLNNLHGSEPTVQYLLDMERKELAHKNDTTTSSSSHKRTATTLNDSKYLKIYGQTENGRNDLDNDNNGMDVDDFMGSYIGETSKTPKRKFDPKTPKRQNDVLFSPASYSPLSNIGTPRGQSENFGKVVYTFGNPNLIKQAKWTTKTHPKLAIKQILHDDENNEEINIKTKFMYDNLMEKSLILGDRLYSIGKEICMKFFDNDIHPIDYDLTNVDIPNQNLINTIGRICCDFDGKLDLTSTILIGTDEMKLRTCRLNFSTTKSFNIFPGQTVMVNGTNLKGDTIFVYKINGERNLHLPIPPKLEESINIVIASGPYTNHDDLVYDPLHDLVQYCKDHTPDVLIMTGPFMEADHSLISGSILAESFETFFDKIISGIVEAIGNDITICLVSSQKDVISNPVYPTHPNVLRKSFPNVHMLPDPCIIDINGLTLGITSTDIVEHLLNEELVVNVGDKIKRIVNYLFHQGSFYPLEPPPLDMFLDSDLASKFAKLEKIPNVMILPSNQKCFIRDIHSSLVINPGRLTDKKGGTFARLLVHPPKEETNLANYVACQVMKV